MCIFFFFYSFINLRNVCFLCSHSFSPRQFLLSGDNKSNLDFYHFSHLHLFPHFSVIINRSLDFDCWTICILNMSPYALENCGRHFFTIFRYFIHKMTSHLIKKTISRLTHYVYLQKCSTHTQTGPRY